MGNEFLLKVSQNYTRSWECGRNELATGSLFTPGTEIQTRSILAQQVDNHRFRVRDEYVLRSHGLQILIYSGEGIVGVCKSPPESLLKLVSDHCGVAVGTVIKVHRRSGAADIAIQ